MSRNTDTTPARHPPHPLVSASEPIIGQLRKGWSDDTFPVIQVSTRMRTTLGLALPTKNIIRLNARLGDDLHELLEEVVTHEYAHLLAHKRHGRRIRPHGAEWQALMRAAGVPPRVRIKLPEGLSVHAGPRWLHVCRSCRSETVAGKPMRRWRCRKCYRFGFGGKLEIRRLTADD